MTVDSEEASVSTISDIYPASSTLRSPPLGPHHSGRIVRALQSPARAIAKGWKVSFLEALGCCNPY